ncbi:MAG TPA: NDP-sugar synthase [Acidimicrobiales bacterium]|nr:NDP-sugar synthase [Acidimicrobiales bacterium]
MDAIVLVGGEGTRLRPLTYDVPKQMLPVVDRPMIEHVAAWLARHGIDRVVLSLGYRPDAFIEAFPSGEIEGARLCYAIEPELLDTAGALRYAAESAGVDDTFVALNGDVLSDFDVTSLVAFHKDAGAEATIQLTPVDDPSSFGVVPTSDDGRVLAFIEKPEPGTARTNMINAGCYVLEPSVLARIAGDRRVSIERETFPLLVAAGSLYAASSESYWLDTGTPAKYLQASLDILRGRRTPASLPRCKEASPSVYVDPSATIRGQLGPSSYAGPGSVLRPGAVLESSVLSSGALVAEGAVVRSSIVMEGAVVGPGAHVDSSIVGPGAVLGEGSQVAGFTVVGASAEVPAGEVLDGARFPRP